MEDKRLKRRIGNFFDELAERRDKQYQEHLIYGYEQRRRIMTILEMLSEEEISNSSVILDAGCGNGRDIEVLLSKYDCCIVGIDFSERMISEAKKKLQVKTGSKKALVRGDLTKIGFKDDTFDVIICSQVLEHIPNWQDALKGLRRILKPEGVLIISTPNIFSLYGVQRKIADLLIGKSHPYDVWKDYKLLSAQLKKEKMEVVSVMGACYLPGMIAYFPPFKNVFSIFLPQLEYLEDKIFQKGHFLKYFGYIIAIKAKKRIQCKYYL